MNILHNHALEVTLVKYAIAGLLLLTLALLTYRNERVKKRNTEPKPDYKLLFEQRYMMQGLTRVA